jgi:hypothetical protein
MDHYNQKPKVKEQNNQDMGGKSMEWSQQPHKLFVE